ncbi:MAG: type II toxin-antitoxin system RatA family toxin [Alphaproteobacteria bacterium]|nr:type II toxin-antitoxin system RatA family toxin [Pseudomonadota bacterium]TDI68290.1 MAG: type II toxin-antitoxin system RatA family toxin [Alphaproteobacteria bacterium]
MHRHAETRSLPYSPKQMFDLVADIGRYPEFLPWCLAARVTGRENGVLLADVVVGKGLFRETFHSRVTLSGGGAWDSAGAMEGEGEGAEAKAGEDKDRAPPRIDVEYIRGPMREMANHWVFHPVDSGTEIDFLVEFNFHSRVLDALIGTVFDHVVTHMVDAFETRADVLYGAGAEAD